MVQHDGPGRDPEAATGSFVDGLLGYWPPSVAETKALERGFPLLHAELQSRAVRHAIEVLRVAAVLDGRRVDDRNRAAVGDARLLWTTLVDARAREGRGWR